MSPLSILLLIKIATTGLGVALPFLFMSKTQLEKITNIHASSPLFFRLYGMAILALLVGYGFGIQQSESGHFPWGVVSMGLISNGGAAYLLLTGNSRKENKYLGIFFGLVAVALIVSVMFRTSVV